MPPPVRSLAPIAIACLALAPAADAGEPQRSRAGPDEQEIEAAERALPRVPTGSGHLRPVERPGVSPSVPGLTSGKDWFSTLAEHDLEVAPPRLLPEGTFISRRRGHLREAPGGRLIFVPDVDQRRRGEGPMLMLPSQTLDAIEAALAGMEDRAPVTVSGQVLLYHGRNYLLPTTFTRASYLVVTEPDEAESAETPDADDDDPEIRSIIEDLAGMRGTDRGIERSTPAVPRLGADRDEAAEGTMAEGTYLLRRRARMERLPTGEWTVTLDGENGRPEPTNGPVREPTLVVLPCALLVSIERRVENREDRLELLVSGRVTSYGGRNYLLPTLLQVARRDGVNPLR